MLLNHCIFIVFYTSLFNFAYSLKEISFQDPNIQYFGHWQTTDQDIQQSGWPGAYFKVILENTSTIKLQFNSHVSIKVQLDKDTLQSFQDTTLVELKDISSAGPHSLIVYTTDIDPPFGTRFKSLWVDDSANTLPPSVQLPLVQFIGHDLSLGIQSSQNLFTSFSFLTKQSMGLEYSFMAYRNATLIDGLDHTYFDSNDTTAKIPWSIVILLGANDDLKLKDQYQNALEDFLACLRRFVQNDDTPIFVLSEPLGDMYYPSQQSVLNRGRHGDQFVFFIDTTAWMRYGPTYYLNPGHLTDAGHQLLAKKLAPFIQTKLSHPKDPLPGPPPNPNLPGDWQTMDVGQEDMIGLPGTVSADSSTTFTLWGSGADIDNDKDGFRFVYQPFSNQGKIESTIRSHSTFAKCAKAGIMIREHLGHGSPFIMLGISPADGIFLDIRYDNFKATKVIKKLRATPPYRLRLTRQKESNLFIAQIQLVDSSFSLDWETFATIPFEIAHDVYAGLAVTSCDTSVVSVAKFTDVQLYHTAASSIEGPQLVIQQ